MKPHYGSHINNQIVQGLVILAIIILLVTGINFTNLISPRILGGHLTTSTFRRTAHDWMLSVDYCARRTNLSQNYFSDLVKKEISKTAWEIES